jgi:hypothetical protein
MSKDEDGDEMMNGGQAKKLNMSGKPGSGFLDVGSVSWSMLISCYFLQLHDDRKSFFITLESIKEMLEVLKNEFKNFVPFETDSKILSQYAADDLQKIKDNLFIDLID